MTLYLEGCAKRTNSIRINESYEAEFNVLRSVFGFTPGDLTIDRQYIQLLVKMLGTPKKCGNISIVMKKFKKDTLRNASESSRKQ
ncbi:LOW QUALITY PROTEIN: hypothetical protein V1477_004628 [Vespula maculifrons]|uniref:Uncharacterized protein n=1 Tax=Vespula maculifrons TaxID=7453 RepID=A0ABD2CMC1_VESMC